jgi:hypothetical protein
MCSDTTTLCLVKIDLAKIGLAKTGLVKIIKEPLIGDLAGRPHEEVMLQHLPRPRFIIAYGWQEVGAGDHRLVVMKRGPEAAFLYP